jgi:hypothetical protein
MSYTAQLRIPVEKQHTCAACGCVFRYQVRKNVAAGGLSQAQAAANLDACVRHQVEAWRKNPGSVAERHPCPGCGLIQPEMVRWGIVSHAAAAGVTFFSLLLLGAASGEWKETGSPSLRGLAVTGLVLLSGLAGLHLFTVFRSPNRDRAANREQARREVAAEVLVLVRPGDPAAADRTPPALTGKKVVPVALVVLTPLLCLVGIVARGGKPAPPVNPILRPAVVEPGESCNCFVPNLRVEGVGPWRGQPTVQILNAKEVGAPDKLEATGSNDPLGSEVKVYTMRGDRPNNHVLSPTIRLSLPKDPALAGKTLQLQVTMNMTYAVLKGSDQFITQTANVSSTFPVHIAPAESLRGGPVYLFGLVVGGIASCLGGLWLTLLALNGPKGGRVRFVYRQRRPKGWGRNSTGPQTAAGAGSRFRPPRLPPGVC